MEKKSFGNWLVSDKYSIWMTVICTILPVILQIMYNAPKSTISIGSSITEFSINLISSITNILIILVVLFWILKTRFLKRESDQQKQLLFEYVEEEFGARSTLYNENESLYSRMHTTLKQFYYSWVIVWFIWLVMYFEKLIFIVLTHYKSFSKFPLLDPDKLNNLICNFLNLSNSFAMFFMYMVITISTVNSSSTEKNRGGMHQGMILLASIWLVLFFFDIFSVFYGGDLYERIQFILRLFIGIIATVAFMTVLGRLNSNYLKLPQWVVISLYVYASLQMLYPISLLEVLNKIIGTSSGLYVFLFYCLFVAIGKLLLFFVVRWIMTGNKFLCFILHKAHIMSEADDVLRNFDLKYEIH